MCVKYISKVVNRNFRFSRNFVQSIIGVILFLNIQESESCCATLRSKSGQKSLVLNDNSVYGNLGEEYVTPEQSWRNVQSTWKVGQSCELETCSEPYFTGQCSKFTEGNTSPSKAWLSGRCKCKSKCTCTSVSIKPYVCAIAYLEPGGCNNCNAPYTELHPGKHELFPEVWTNKVSSYLVKSGCTLKIYKEEDFAGNSETIMGSRSLKELNHKVGSYECECNKDSNSHPSLDIESLISRKSVEVPSTIDDVITKFAEGNFTHPGLQAALSSLVNGRSSKNVYLLMLGSSGAGKSSAINVLLDTPNVTIAGGATSTTSEILEFRVPIPIFELGIKNSELRIIDTPGLGDTRGLENDARLLASLDHYLSNHEELKNKIPNLVLIFHNFNDNRFSGDGANYVKMIRGFDSSIRSKITDENYSNVLFVFSHLCSVQKGMQRNPSLQLLKYKEVIELYSFFPKPIMTSVIENKAEENDLFMRNGNFELPNQELYPQNLFDKFDTITRKCNDKIGNAVVTSRALKNHGDSLNITQIIHPLVNSHHIKVSKYLNMLTSATFRLNSSAVANALSETQKRMPKSISQNFPKTLQNIQRYLSLKNINTLTDVPKTTTAILELISGIEDQNDAVTYLLDNGLSLKAPAFPMNTLAGYSYDISKNTILSVSPFNMNTDNKPSSIGFLLPENIQFTKTDHSSKEPITNFKTFNCTDEYFEYQATKLLPRRYRAAANSTKVYSAVTSKLMEGYYVKDKPCSENSQIACFTVTRFYKIGQFDLIDVKRPNGKSQLQSGFLKRLESIGPFNQSGYENVEEWTTFFNDFGTHIVKSAEVGGRIDINFKTANKTSVNDSVEKVLKSLEFAENPLKSVSKYQQDAKTVFSQITEIDHKLAFRGGNSAYHVPDISKLTLDKAYQLIKEWKKSIQFYPSVFPHEILPISEVISKYFPSSEQVKIQEKLETALNRFLSSTLKYVEPEPTPDPKVIAELERLRMENEERFVRMQLLLKQKTEESEKLRLEEEEAQRRREQAEYERNERRQKDLREAEEKRIRDARDRNRRLQELKWQQEEELARLRNQRNG